jgi:hypothetical protein
VIGRLGERVQEWREKERERWSGRRRWWRRKRRRRAQAVGVEEARRRELTEVRDERCPEMRRAACARRRTAGLAATAASQEEGWALSMPLAMGPESL